jgi:CRISPR/Cas system-associated exonuclease Cas4 (RecB family)
LINEKEILVRGGKTRRPDRVIIWKNEVHVVDFKFGQERNESSHSKQVRDYMELLSEMGNPVVKGFLWYIERNEVVTVGEVKR